MAVDKIVEFDDWYIERGVDTRTGALSCRAHSPYASALWTRFEKYRGEMDARVKNYYKLVKLADGEVISPKDDLPNISSGETAGMIRRMARNLVQNAPNVEVISKFDDDDAKGIFTRHILKHKILGEDLYSNNMQQNLFASAKNSLTLGFDCVIPVMLQGPGGSWYVKYDNIHYRDVFPEPGVKDVRQANEVFVRRYLTKGDIHALIAEEPAGWDIPALKALCEQSTRPRHPESVDHQTRKHGSAPEGYEVITWYAANGDKFLTFDAHTKNLLRIEQNKHPLKEHPVFFLVMEKDLNQPLGKSQVELVLGRQEFQDLILNGAMKMWYRNINPAIIGYGTVNAIPNLGPGKYTEIGNPNARIEPFEVNTQTLMQYNSIAQQNAGNMGQLIGAADQQMASQSTGGMMSQTPQGVNAQQELVDITTNNYQKAIEAFFSHYCSYAMTLYFHELSSVKKVTVTADARRALLHASFAPEDINPDGEITIDFSELATEYFVKTVPGSLVEMEDEKQLRILNELLIPISQTMQALAAAQDMEAITAASSAMKFIIERQLELSGSAHGKELRDIMAGRAEDVAATADGADAVEDTIGSFESQYAENMANMGGLLTTLADQVSLLSQSQTEIMSRLGISSDTSAPQEPEPAV